MFAVPENLPFMLNLAAEKVVNEFGGEKDHPLIGLARSSKRKMRSDSQTTLVNVMRAVFSCVDLRTLKLGYPVIGGTFINRTWSWMAKTLGYRTDADDLEDAERIANGRHPRRRGLKKVYRAVAYLKKMGLLSVEYLAKGITAIKRLSEHFFTIIGITPPQLNKSRALAREMHSRKEKTCKVSKVAVFKQKAMLTLTAQAIFSPKKFDFSKKPMKEPLERPESPHAIAEKLPIFGNILPESKKISDAPQMSLQEWTRRAILIKQDPRYKDYTRDDIMLEFPEMRR